MHTNRWVLIHAMITSLCLPIYPQLHGWILLTIAWLDPESAMHFWSNVVQLVTAQHSWSLATMVISPAQLGQFPPLPLSQSQSLAPWHL
jgi:hypothetical protein